jgi:hypothetical protein
MYPNFTEQRNNQLCITVSLFYWYHDSAWSGTLIQLYTGILILVTTIGTKVYVCIIYFEKAVFVHVDQHLLQSYSLSVLQIVILF